MILKNHLKLGIAISCFVLGDQAWAQTQEADDAGLVFEPCVLTLPGTPISGPAECGELMVAENPADPEGRQISLNIARVPASGRNAEPDPVFLFAGGPGQAATEAWLIVAGAFRKVNENRDIILIDQRGTGKSNPLKCPEIELEEALSTDWEAIEEFTRECLQGVDGDPRFYTTTIGMQDYDIVREALGYQEINLWGASYGTRAAQVYMRMFPDRVRTAVLDSVVPQELPLGIDHAIMLDKAVFRVLENCDNDQDCDSQFPNTSQKLRNLVARLESTPVETTIDHPSTGEPLTLTFDRDALAGSLRFLMYSPSSQALLPLLITEAADDNDFGRLASQMIISTSGISDMIAMGMEMSVTCAEDFPFFPHDDSSAGLLMGNTMVEATRSKCGVWPQGDVPDGFHDPVESDKPVLLLSGELDPVTPPEYADQVAKHLPNSLHVVAPGQGHSVTGQGCLADIVADFISSANLDGLETECINQLSTTPYFMSLTGPKP
ncbi:MAG TPA: alpha/beta hydrolase [Xanthomonadales bacterium]|nr:alpha/beta hydrolase [Xanthomonadales bacterium]